MPILSYNREKKKKKNYVGLRVVAAYNTTRGSKGKPGVIGGAGKSKILN